MEPTEKPISDNSCNLWIDNSRNLWIGLVLPNTPAWSETFFRSKIRGLKAAGHRVILFVGSHGKRGLFEGCRVVPAPRVYRSRLVQLPVFLLRLVWLGLRAPRRSWCFFQMERQAGRSWREALENLYLNSHILPQRLDWLHFGFATMAVRREHVAKAMGARMALSLRGYDICLYPLKHPGCYSLAWQQVDKVHTISDALLDVARREGLPANVPVRKITPAIDVHRFSTNGRRFLLHRPLRLLTVARLKWVKGLEYTLEALALLHRKGFDFHYTIIGSGNEYERLVFAAHQLGIRERVRFAGRLPHEDVKRAMEAADIYLQYSIQEGFCNAVLEAQAMGLLCIVSDAEGLPENVLHGRTGWVVPKRQPDLLAAQIEAVLQMPPEQHEQIRRQAVERVRREFNLEKQQREFLEFYK